MQAKNGYRVLWFTSFKACINTIMVHTGWKNPGHFKFTPKAGIATQEQAVSGTVKYADTLKTTDKEKQPDRSTQVVPENTNAKKDGVQSGKGGKKQGVALTDIHGALSKVFFRCSALRLISYCCVLVLL